MSERTRRVLERLSLTLGLVLLAGFGAAHLDQLLSSRLALGEFDRARAEALEQGEPSGQVRSDGDVDVSLWSEKRVREYEASLKAEKRLPIAVLEIPGLRLRVPVLEGTDDMVLNRGAGWIPGTARPGEEGNVGIAAHRDGFFRGLKDLALGDTIDLATLHGQASYVVDQIEIVSPERVDVLGPRREPSVTLVTCYPFYFVGDAPQRYIVHATLDRSRTRSEPETGRR